MQGAGGVNDLFASWHYCGKEHRFLGIQNRPAREMIFVQHTGETSGAELFLELFGELPAYFQ